MTQITTLFVIAALWAFGAHADDLKFASDVTFTFTASPVVPDYDVPEEARRAGTTPAPEGEQMAPSEIELVSIHDIQNRGAFSNVANHRVSAITVTWSDLALLATEQDTEDFLRRLLTTRAGSTYGYVPWSQGLGIPSVAATVQHHEGKSGQWLVWYGWPSVYCAYQDGAGTWWFSVWFEDEDVRIEVKETETQ